MSFDQIIVPIKELLEHRAHYSGNKAAFSDLNRSVTYGELNVRVGLLATWLRKQGLGTEDRTLMFLGNSVEVVEGYLAAPVGGFVTACVNPDASQRELDYMMNDSAPKVVLTDKSRLPMIVGALESTPSVEAIVVVDAEGTEDFGIDIPVVAYQRIMNSVADTSVLEPAGLDDWCWLLYTSGTTGKPKGVMLKQRGGLWVTENCWVSDADLNAEDRLLSALPLFHSYALILCVVSVVAVGASIDLLPKFSRAEVEHRLARDPITILPGVPTMFQYLMQGSSADRLDAPHLRVCVSAGALMQGALNQQFEDFAGVPLLDGYGITETSTMVTMNSLRRRRIPGSCGFPVSGLTVRLIDPSTNNDVTPGSVGELWVQGPNIMIGYFQRPEADKDVLVNGWYRTGDLGRRDENGFLFITGRIKEMIIRGGENIYPAEIEAVLFECPGVEDAAVLGEEHPGLGEVPVAYVVPEDPDSFDERYVKAFCAERLTHFKVPENVRMLHDIPRTGSGKIQRFKLRETSDNVTTA